MLSDIFLCGNKLPWVDTFKHLGNTVSNKFPFTEQDAVVKRAQYVQKNLELSQEFHFASCETKVQLNEIYNSHYYGSPLWNLCGRAVKSFESSYNRAIKVIYDLPLQTHRNLIETISGRNMCS